MLNNYSNDVSEFKCWLHFWYIEHLIIQLGAYKYSLYKLPTLAGNRWTEDQKEWWNKIHCTSTPPTHPLPHSSSSGRGYLEVSKKTPSHWIFEKYFQPYRILNHNGHIKEALDCIIYSLQLKNKFSEKIMQIKNKIEQGSYTLTLPLCFAFPSLRGK